MPEVEMTKTETAPETSAPATEQTAAEMVTLSKAEFEKMQKALKEANAEATKRRKELEERQRAEMTEADKLKADLEVERTERLALLRETVATKHNLPAALAARLQGATREELEADAKTLAELMPKPAPKSPGPVNPQAETKKTYTPEQLAKMTPSEINTHWAEISASLENSK